MDQNGLLDKLNQIAEHFDEVQQLLAKPDAMQDMKRFVALNKSRLWRSAKSTRSF